MKYITFLIIILLFIIKTSLASVYNTYGKNDLGNKPPFQGNFINFGYWKNIDIERIITKEDRINASKSLYNLIFELLEPSQKDIILEIGCGRGQGCIFLLNTYSPSGVIGIDIVPQQIKRAKNLQLNKYENLTFKIASANDTGLENNSVDKAYSVEAAQYFPSIKDFSQEMQRILKPGGKLIITAHFSNNHVGFEKLKTLIPTVNDGEDKMIPIQDVLKGFENSKLKLIKMDKIGQFVFEGFDKWILQVEDVDWAHNIYRAYKEGFIDYYVLVYENVE